MCDQQHHRPSSGPDHRMYFLGGMPSHKIHYAINGDVGLVRIEAR